MYIIISFYRVCQYFIKPKECSTVIYSICHHNGRKHLQLCLTPDNPEIRFSALQFKLKWINYTARRFEKRTIKLSHFLTELDLAQNSLKLWLIDTGQKPASDIGVGLTESRLKNLDDERQYNISKHETCKDYTQKYQCQTEL